MNKIKLQASLIGLVLFSTFLGGCIDKEEPVLDARVRPVRTLMVKPAPQAIDRRFAGGSQAAISSRLSFRTGGEITALPVKEGEAVKQGQLIAQLNDADLRISMARDEAALRNAKAQAANSKGQFARMKNLLDRKLISRAEFDNAKADDEAAQARADEVAGSLALSRKKLSYTRLISPADGCSVSEVHVEVNENIDVGQPVVTLNCGTSVEVLVIVPENIIPELSVGESVSVAFPSFKDRNFPAVISEIGNSKSNNSAYPVTVRMSNQDRVLRPGMAAEVTFRVRISQATDNFWVPLIAVGKEDGATFVYVYEPQDDGRGIVKRRAIDIALFTLDQVEVTAGLTEGEQIITAGMSQIHEGLTVSLLPAQGENATP